MDTLTRVKQVIAEKLDMDESAIEPQTTLTDLDGDSLSQLEVVMALEETFGLHIEDDNISMTTVQQIVDMIEAQIGLPIEKDNTELVGK